jgi:hypothetical protein
LRRDEVASGLGEVSSELDKTVCDEADTIKKCADRRQDAVLYSEILERRNRIAPQSNVVHTSCGLTEL